MSIVFLVWGNAHYMVKTFFFSSSFLSLATLLLIPNHILICFLKVGVKYQKLWKANLQTKQIHIHHANVLVLALVIWNGFEGCVSVCLSVCLEMSNCEFQVYHKHIMWSYPGSFRSLQYKIVGISLIRLILIFTV